MLKELLIISPYAPYKSVKHAGGQIHYYYVNKLAQNNSVTLISFANIKEKAYIEKEGISCRSFIFYEKRGFSSATEFFQKLISFWWYKNPFNKYGGIVNYQYKLFLIKIVKQLYKEGYSPDYILFDWLQSSFFIKKVKRFFPNSKTICIEQDVVFLNFLRRFQNSECFLDAIFNFFKLKIVKKAEKKALLLSNEILVLNNKDKNLLLNDKSVFPPIRIISPYYHSFLDVKRSNSPNNDILFYGAMNRNENYEAAIWFIENVFNKLDNSYNFLIIGNAPPEKLMKYKSEHIHILGFVEDISPYFADSLCLVVPLLVGAGIKIKVLEGLSAGIPVLTNDIGIEGIPAKNNIEYLHCTDSQDYINAITKLANDGAFCLTISENAKLFMRENFNFENDTYLQL